VAAADGNDEVKSESTSTMENNKPNDTSAVPSEQSQSNGDSATPQIAPHPMDAVSSPAPVLASA
jgi:hypothetical protein